MLFNCSKKQATTKFPRIRLFARSFKEFPSIQWLYRSKVVAQMVTIRWCQGSHDLQLREIVISLDVSIRMTLFGADYINDVLLTHINCFCFFLNDLQVNLSVTGRYLLSCREDNLGKIWLIVVRVKWVAAVVVAPITAFHFSFVCFFLEDLLVNLSILRPFCFRAEIRNNLRKVWQIVGCQGNTRGVAKETVKTSTD